MDVPAIISDKFQQFFIVYVKVPQLQFIDRVVGFVVRRDRYTVQTAQKTVVIAQVQFLDGWDTRRCTTTGALVSRAENCGSSAVAVL